MKIDKIKPVFSDDRGEIYDILSDSSIRHITIFTINKDSVRGKHYHKEQKQWIFLLKGQIKVKTKNLLEKNSKIEEVILNEKDMIFLPQYFYREIIGITNSECLFITSKFRKNSLHQEDTFSVNDIESFELTQNS
jgi:dTDP-4-dehydrorhamnose 3,5-epimerase-like enzyme